MLTRKDLEGQKTFREYPDGKGDWYEGGFDYCISKNGGGYSFCSHSEVDGSTEVLCDKIDNLEHLKDLYESTSGEIFE
jgi:hypothetical protein